MDKDARDGAVWSGLCDRSRLPSFARSFHFFVLFFKHEVHGRLILPSSMFLANSVLSVRGGLGGGALLIDLQPSERKRSSAKKKREAIRSVTYDVSGGER